MAERLTRGSSIKGHLRYVEKRFGKLGLEECKKAVGLDYKLREKEFYPDKIQNDILKWLSRNKGPDMPRLSGKFTVKNLGILAYIVRFTSPEMMVKKARESYDELYNFGRIETKVMGKGRIYVRLYDVCSIPERCKSWQGVLEGILELTRTEGRVEKTKCQLKGGPYCEYIVTY